MNNLLPRIKELKLQQYQDKRAILKTVVDALHELLGANPDQEVVEHKGREYLFLKMKIGNDTRMTRPFRKDLVDLSPADIKETAQNALAGNWCDQKARSLERFIYSAQQIIGCYLDFFNPNSARKVAGTVFECLMACALYRVCSLPVSSGTIKIPGSEKPIQIDLRIRSNQTHDLLIATKTSTRERLSQPFVQKYIIDRTIKFPPKSILVVIGDVQHIRNKSGVQHTFTQGQFQLYWKHLTPMDGVYYIDIPPQAETKGFIGHVKSLHELFAIDLNQFLGLK